MTETSRDAPNERDALSTGATGTSNAHRQVRNLWALHVTVTDAVRDYGQGWPDGGRFVRHATNASMSKLFTWLLPFRSFRQT